MNLLRARAWCRERQSSPFPKVTLTRGRLSSMFARCCLFFVSVLFPCTSVSVSPIPLIQVAPIFWVLAQLPSLCLVLPSFPVERFWKHASTQWHAAIPSDCNYRLYFPSETLPLFLLSSCLLVLDVVRSYIVEVRLSLSSPGEFGSWRVASPGHTSWC